MNTFTFGRIFRLVRTAVTDFIAMSPQDFSEIEYEESRGLVLGAIDYAIN